MKITATNDSPESKMVQRQGFLSSCAGALLWVAESLVLVGWLLGRQRNLAERKKVEQELARSRAYLAAILKSSIDGLIVYEAVRDGLGTLRDLRFMLINPAAEKLFRTACVATPWTQRVGKIPHRGHRWSLSEIHADH
jgi:PAS domain-containing protein